MLSAVDLARLSRLLHDFSIVFPIRITVFDEDLHELLSYPEHRPSVCCLIRSSSHGEEACVRCDRTACMEAAQKMGYHIYQCHAGLTESVMPLYVDDILTGYLFLGNMFSFPSTEDGIRAVKERCRSLLILPDELERTCRERPLISRAYVQSASQILYAAVSYLLMEHRAVIRGEDKALQLYDYISAHFTEPLSIDTLCQQLCIGRTQLYRLSQQLYGCGTSQQIRKLRIELAKSILLRDPSAPITEIADACGYSDYNYFISVFSRETGCSPGAFRKAQIKRIISDLKFEDNTPANP